MPDPVLSCSGCDVRLLRDAAPCRRLSHACASGSTRARIASGPRIVAPITRAVVGREVEFGYYQRAGQKHRPARGKTPRGASSGGTQMAKKRAARKTAGGRKKAGGRGGKKATRARKPARKSARKTTRGATRRGAKKTARKTARKATRRPSPKPQPVAPETPGTMPEE